MLYGSILTMIYPLLHYMKAQLNRSGLTTEDVEQVLGVAQSLFGKEWLEDLIKVRKETPMFSQHPIMVGSSSGSFNHLIELVEVCTYFVSFKGDKEIMTLIPPIKEVSSYGDVLFQLAMAYRFKKLGFNVILEPAIENGLLADFTATLGDIKVVAECTVLREWRVRVDERDAFEQCIDKLKKIHKKGGREFSIDIVCKKPLTFETMDSLRVDIVKVGTDFINTQVAITISTDLYKISITAFTEEIKKLLSSGTKADFKKLGDWDQIASFGLGTQKVGGDITSALDNIERECLIRYKSIAPPEEEFAYSLEDKIDKKVGTKTRQLKSHPKDHKSILFVEVEDKLDGLDFDRTVRRLKGSVFKKVPTLSGIFISKRDWSEEIRHQYQGIFISNEENPLNKHLFDAFNSQEVSISFPEEWRSSL